MPASDTVHASASGERSGSAFPVHPGTTGHEANPIDQVVDSLGGLSDATFGAGAPDVDAYMRAMRSFQNAGVRERSTSLHVTLAHLDGMTFDEAADLLNLKPENLR